MRDYEIKSQLASAKELFRQDDYHSTAAALAVLIVNCERPPLEAIDLLARAYIALGALPAALEDGKSTIRLYPSRVEGYLRTVQILRLMNRQGEASRVCCAGLCRIEKDHPDYDILADVRRQVIAVDPSLKAMDPLVLLPLEILIMVLRYLDYREFVTMLSITKAWKNAVESLPEMWCKLNLSASSHSHVSPSYIERCIELSGNAISHATFSPYDGFHYMSSRELLKPLLTRCPLQYLKLQSATPQSTLSIETLEDIASVPTLKTLILDCAYPISTSDVAMILERGRSLEVAEIHNAYVHEPLTEWPLRPQLTALVLNCFRGACSTMNLLIGNIFLRSFPNLKKLELQRWKLEFLVRSAEDNRALSKLEILLMDNSILLGAPLLPSRLRVFIRHMAPGIRVPPNEATTVQLPHLQALCITGWSNEYDVVRAVLASAKHQLRVFGITFWATFNAACWRILETGLLASVEVLCLSCYLGDFDLKLLAKTIPALYELRICSGFITEASIRALLVKKGVPLRKLTSLCDSIDEKTIAFARANGVTVDVQIMSSIHDGSLNRKLVAGSQEVPAAFMDAVDDLDLAPKL